ncbi:MAG: hypothetical protein WBW81_13615 [Methylocella sp.]
MELLGQGVEPDKAASLQSRDPTNEITLIVEAKLGDTQWARELAAYSRSSGECGFNSRLVNSAGVTHFRVRPTGVRLYSNAEAFAAPTVP